jgi:hypothetical protein
VAKKKSKLQKKKDDPRSKYWKARADKLWGMVIHEIYGECAIGENCAGNLEAHHLITRSNVGTRHSIENGILLCSKHHKYCTKISAHMAPLSFSEWLQQNKPETWQWCSENKRVISKPDYKQAYENLLSYCTENNLNIVI